MADMPDVNQEERRANRQDLTRLWEQHRTAEWPVGVGVHEGALMTLDTVFGGCVLYILEERRLDPQRVTILEDGLSELDAMLPEVHEESLDYFERLKRLGALVLDLGRCE